MIAPRIIASLPKELRLPGSIEPWVSPQASLVE
jgi:hypothetical protein